MRTLDQTTVGTPPFFYRIQDDWAKLPEGWAFGADVAGVAVDHEDRVYAFNRGEHPVIVFDRDGSFLGSWGEGQFARPHGAHFDPKERVLYLTDDGAHVVRKCTLDGKVLLEIGVPGKPSGFLSGEPFNRCTHTALAPNGDIYVSDGYANASVHKFTAAGKLILSWGRCGSDPGEFNIPHNIVADEEGFVYVADRENHRVQVFDGNGRYQTQWNNLHRPCCLYYDPNERSVYIGELPPHQPVNLAFPNLGPRVTIADRTGKRVGRIDENAGLPPNQMLAPHGIALDSRGDLYVSEVSFTAWSKYVHPGVDFPPGLRALHKLV
ncbi:MAG: hypothetical protein JOY59_09420, partial [Candidatus Eremiobacteraeota bacterium]|nr:hypothetical protein [Candidatus Eremiobacteraeota bacterium]